MATPAKQRQPGTPVLMPWFQNLDTQEHAARLGFWLFLGSELLLFAGFFGLYASYRVIYGPDFLAAAAHNDPMYGTVNTAVLIISSFFVAMSIYFQQHAQPKKSVVMLVLTLLCGAIFMVVKVKEYAHHIHEGILPGIHYHYDALPTYGARMFFTLYFLMTGLHGIHVLMGMTFLAWLVVKVAKNSYSPKHYVALELGGLYWHLVDLIWIFLWPLLYLTR